MSHSCVPNCAHSVFPNKTLALQAKHKIKAGEEFTIAYISPLQGSLKRRNKLHDKWFFDCNCPRCASPTELKSYTSTHLCPVNFWDFHSAKNLDFLTYNGATLASDCEFCFGVETAFCGKAKSILCNALYILLLLKVVFTQLWCKAAYYLCKCNKHPRMCRNVDYCFAYRR